MRLATERQQAAVEEIRRKSKGQETVELCRLATGLLNLRRADNAAQQSAASLETQSPSSPEAD